MAKYMVTSALPYANGPIHLGHLAGAYLPADIFVRYLKLNHEDVVYVCGTDEHGVPITIRAEREHVSPKDIVDRFHNEMTVSFRKMGINFDNFSGTSREKHHYELSQRFFTNLNEGGHIIAKTEEQFYCKKCVQFLPDRYVEGVCPHCGYNKARGDQCDKCGKLLHPLELIEPRCALCGEKPEIRQTKHWYLKLQDFEADLKQWLTNKTEWKDNVRKFMLGWIETEGLKERAITRDIDWGIPVPLPEAKGKVLYVWFDAPIGYISSTMEWAEKIGQPDRWKDYWLNPETKLIHFIGKDNIPFHAIIWPAVLMGQKEGFILPYDIPANEYLNLEGDKISTSLDWAVWVDEYLDIFPPDPLRYFLASNAPESKDSDFSWKGFQSKNNDELANILGNFANRTLTFMQNFCECQITPFTYNDTDEAVFSSLKEKVGEVKRAFETYRVREASKLVMDIARIGNKYFDEMKPWVLKKEDSSRLCTVMNVCMNIMRSLCIAMYPILPFSAEKLWKMMGEPKPILEESWESAAEKRIAVGQRIGEIEILFVKYEDDVIQAQIDRLYKKTKKNKIEANMEIEEKNTVTIDEFKRFDLRVAEILSAEAMEKSNKLIKLKVKVGDIEKQILAGIKQFYSPMDLVGKKVVIINNLEPAKLMGELSEGMILAASNADKSALSLLSPMTEMESGAKIS